MTFIKKSLTGDRTRINLIILGDFLLELLDSQDFQKTWPWGLGHWKSGLFKILNRCTYGIKLTILGHVFLELLCSQSWVSTPPVHPPGVTTICHQPFILRGKTPAISLCICFSVSCTIMSDVSFHMCYQYLYQHTVQHNKCNQEVPASLQKDIAEPAQTQINTVYEVYIVSHVQYLQYYVLYLLFYL